jgi:rhamnose utilization protein RhaD (predicted bifunctional aldolase and dehydrogenase)
LKDALIDDIFVPVDLSDLTAALSARNFDAKPRLMVNSLLRPSIETALHGLLPQRVVVHLHAIEALAILVRPDAWRELEARLPLRWRPCFVPYCKPGAELAQVVHSTVQANPRTQLVCMGNHGVVLAGDSVGEVEAILDDVVQALRSSPQVPIARTGLAAIHVDEHRSLVPIPDAVIQGLDLSRAGLLRMANTWALYPDHVVFLGAQPICHDSVDAAVQTCIRYPSLGVEQPHFIRDTGVFAFEELSPSRQAQLRCYADVLLRQPPHQQLNALGADDVAALLSWDAERYRQQINK